MLPISTFTLVYPDVLADTQGGRRLHNKAGKEAMEGQLALHHRKRIPGHFDANNRSKYSHMARKEKYKRWKYRRFGSRTDLVASGATRAAMTRIRQTQIGGTASGETGLRGKLILKFPFTSRAKFQQWQRTKAGRPRHQANVATRGPGVTIDQMRLEISTVTDQENREIADGLATDYTQRLNAALASRPRLRKKIS